MGSPPQRFFGCTPESSPISWESRIPPPAKRTIIRKAGRNRVRKSGMASIPEAGKAYLHVLVAYFLDGDAGICRALRSKVIRELRQMAAHVARCQGNAVGWDRVWSWLLESIGKQPAGVTEGGKSKSPPARIFRAQKDQGGKPNAG